MPLPAANANRRELMSTASDCLSMEHAQAHADAHARDMAIADTALTGINASIEVSSSAFGYDEPIPMLYTADVFPSASSSWRARRYLSIAA